MIGHMLVIHTDGTFSRRAITEVPDLDKIQAAVGGFIEAVPYWDQFEGRRCVAFCNEEGKLNGLETNMVATTLWRGMAKIDDVLVGNVVVIYGDDELIDAI